MRLIWKLFFLAERTEYSVDAHILLRQRVCFCFYAIFVNISMIYWSYEQYLEVRNMKTITRILSLLMVLVIPVMLAACTDTQSGLTVAEVSEALELDLSDAAIVSMTDTHAGFHGDGTTFAVISASESTGGLIELSEHWKPLPLSENITALVYGISDDNRAFGPYITSDSSTEPLIPQIDNGYVYFYDRSTESTNPYDDSEVLSRYSFNFTLAMYDADTCTIYYVEFDT